MQHEPVDSQLAFDTAFHRVVQLSRALIAAEAQAEHWRRRHAEVEAERDALQREVSEREADKSDGDDVQGGATD